MDITIAAGADRIDAEIRWPAMPGKVPCRNPTYAASVLEEYLSSTNEIAFEVRQIRPASEGHAYVEITRRYVVEGTSDVRVETVFFGFRRIEGRWRLREVRVTPLGSWVSFD